MVTGSAYQALQMQPQGRIPQGGTGQGPMRPVCGTFKLAALTNPIVDETPVWTTTDSELTPVFATGPFFDDNSAVSISGTSFIPGPGHWEIGMDLMVECVGGGPETFRMAITDNAGTGVKAEILDVSIPLNGFVRLRLVTKQHYNPEDTNNHLVFRALQTTAGANQLAIHPEYTGYFKKLGNADEGAVFYT